MYVNERKSMGILEFQIPRTIVNLSTCLILPLSIYWETKCLSHFSAFHTPQLFNISSTWRDVKAKGPIPRVCRPSQNY